MGIFFQTKEIETNSAACSLAAQRQKELLTQLWQTANAYQPYGQAEKKAIQRKLNDLKQLLYYDQKERKQGLSSFETKKKEALLNTYASPNTVKAIAKLADDLNSYNKRETDAQRWVDVKVQFLRYCAKNELIQERLEKLTKLAQNVQAEQVMQKISEVSQFLTNEEETLWGVVQDLEPPKAKPAVSAIDNYRFSANYLKRKADSHGAGQYTEYLQVFLRWEEEAKTDLPPKKEILAADKYLRAQAQRNLTHQEKDPIR